MINITLERGRLYVRFPYNELDVIKAKNIPDRSWNKSAKAWTCRPTLANIKYLDEVWSSADWSKEAETVRSNAYAKEDARKATLEAKAAYLDTSVLNNDVFKFKPLEHQRHALTLSRGKENFAYLMDMGTGKTKTLIDDACHLYREAEIDVVMVFTINSVKTNWVINESLKDEPTDKDALETHMPPDIQYIKGVWVSQPRGETKREWREFEQEITKCASDRMASINCPMVWIAANIESVRLERAFDWYRRVIEAFGGRVLICVDESTIIGTPGSKQTKGMQKLRKLCSYARILSGSPVIKSPLKAYSQFAFLDEDILGYGSFYAFKHHFCIMGGFENKQVIAYRNLEELNEKIASVSYRVLKDQCLELPPQEFHKRRVEMTREQEKQYAAMQEKFMAVNEKSQLVEAKIVLEQMLRLQQITGGYLPEFDEVGEVIGTVPIMDPAQNPKFKEMLQIIEEGGDQKFLVWSRFTDEIDGMVELLRAKGYKVEPFYGALSDKEKIAVRKRMARGELDGVVGNPAAGGLGIDEFKVASIVIYVTNSFDTEKRKQSEDRAHRMGSEMHDKITYFDIMVPNTVDVKVVATMRENVKIANAVMGDNWKEWI